MTQRKADSLLARLWARCKLAVPVWLLLAQQAMWRGRRRFAVKRRTLARELGLARLPSVSQALTALHELGVIHRRVRRCRRPDGTLFYKLTVQLKRDPVEAHAESAHRVRKTGYAPGTAPGNEKRNHSPGTPGIKKRYTSSIEDEGTCGVSTPRRTLAAGAGAAGQRRCADAQRLARPPAAASHPPTQAESSEAQVLKTWKEERA